MPDVLLFHHAQGLTDGVRDLAERLRSAGHRTVVPDLYDGALFSTLQEGLAHAQAIGFDAILERGRQAGALLPGDVVVAGISLGVMPAQMLVQTRPGARGALFLHSCVPTSAFGRPWPGGVPVQIHAMERDAIFVAEGDLAAARDLVAAVPGAELFLYPGDQHLFTDRTLSAYDDRATALLIDRVLAFLDRLDRPGGPAPV